MRDLKTPKNLFLYHPTIIETWKQKLNNLTSERHKNIEKTLCIFLSFKKRPICSPSNKKWGLNHIHSEILKINKLKTLKTENHIKMDYGKPKKGLGYYD